MDRMTVAADIESRLKTAFSPSFLEVIDDSARHAGHVGAKPGGQTHFKVTLVADVFDGKSRVECHRMVYDVLKEELAGPVHALNIDARSA